MTRSRFDLFLVSFVTLFLEMAFLRWAPAQFRVLAYYTNIVLIACFLGMGIGCLLVRRKFDWTPLLPLLFLITVAVILAARQYQFHFTHGGDFQLWQTNVLEGGRRAGDLDLKALLVSAFLLTAVLFVPLGQMLGRALEGHPPLVGYGINLAGSLAGVVGHAAVSWLALPPAAWFGAALAGYLLCLRERTGALLLGLLATAVALLLIAHDDRDMIWSPYYKLRLVPVLPGQGTDSPMGFSLDVNEDYHQNAMNLSDAAIQKTVSWQAWRTMYDTPYRFAEAPGRVLILGAGTGNDVAAALRNGARWIDAVEIDPAIAALGRNHPEHPYQDPRVHLHIDDARSFIQRATPGAYDLVVFGFLDSHRLFSSMSSVRLDTYVYTVECFRRVRELLAPQGGVALSFCINQRWIAHRLSVMLQEAFGIGPAVVKGPDEIHLVYLAGPGMAARLGPTRMPEGAMEASTDDWPYLYLRERGIPADYWIMIAVVGLLSIGAVLAAAPSAHRVELHFFFLGAAFMLLETRSMTVLALLFGSTWVVNFAVFTGILLAILAMTVWVEKRGFPRRWAYVGLALALIAAAALPPARFLAWMGTAGAIPATAVACLPLFFAAGVFAVSFRDSADVTRSLGSNLIGTVLGGFAEYTSLVFGLSGLVPFAAGLYLLSALTLPRRPLASP